MSSYWPNLLVNAVVCAAALWYWLRSQKAGFAWIAVAFGLNAIMPILFSFLFSVGLRYSPGLHQLVIFGLHELLIWSFRILFLIFMLIGDT